MIKRIFTISTVLVVCVAITLFYGFFVSDKLLLYISQWQDLRPGAIHLLRLKRRIYWLNGLKFPNTANFGASDRHLIANEFTLGSPVFIRIFKLEFELEFWIKRNGRFHLFAIYPICNWSGRLGPKLVIGDRQSPEGFYTVSSKAMHATSRWHKSFNLGFPNAYDRMHGRTGDYLMVHGGCSSIGCYAITDNLIDEVWRFIVAAHKSGQKRFHIHIYPFRMTTKNLNAYTSTGWKEFWDNLKVGYDTFEKTWFPPKVFVCNGNYAFLAVNDVSSDGAHRIRSYCPQ
ncbi:MAG: murein L,D-transpeptidase [Hyphomicrobiaceae bacterium]|nr:murein L,D-transpeptidase [Hyphomicrobiaceae bacterium]